MAASGATHIVGLQLRFADAASFHAALLFATRGPVGPGEVFGLAHELPVDPPRAPQGGTWRVEVGAVA